jgi:hypothetical protein
MKKNWFMADNQKIIDLSRMTGFFTSEQKNTYLVYGTNHFDENELLGEFDTLAEAQGYLEQIYNQLWEGEYSIPDHETSQILNGTYHNCDRIDDLNEDECNHV